MSNLTGFVKRLRDIMRNDARRPTHRTNYLAFIFKGV